LIIHKFILSYCCLLVFFLICSSLYANELLNLGLDDEVYTFIKRVQVKKLIDKRINNTRPIPRREIAEALIEISEKLQKGQISLTNSEKEQLDKYKWLFGDDIKSLKSEISPFESKKNIITISGEGYKFDLDFKAEQEAVYIISDPGDGQNKSITSLDLSLKGKLSRYLGFFSKFYDRMLVGEADYNPYKNELFKEFLGKSEAVNTMEGYIIMASPQASIQWGIDGCQWGPGYNGALLVSNNSAPKDNLRITGLYGPIRFTYFTGILRESKPKYETKYMAAHRIELIPYKGINLGLSETVVFADRYELRYLNPIISFYMSQFEDFRNNGLLGFDFDIILLPSIEFYGEFMVDDLQPSAGRDILKVWNSKYGILFGTYLADPFGIKDTNLRLEYAFVNQYAYTHRYDITRYTHQDFIIGHWIGTDADNLYLDIGHWLNKRVRASLIYQLTRNGEGDVKKKHHEDRTPNDVSIPDVENPPKYWEFLSGITEINHSFSTGIFYDSIGKYQIAIDYTYSIIKNVQNELGLDKNQHLIKMKANYKF